MGAGRLCRQPLRLRAFGYPSDPCEWYQGVLAGCSHAKDMLCLLISRALRRLNSIAPKVTPKALVDDIPLPFILESKQEIAMLCKGRLIFQVRRQRSRTLH
eukprot:8304381-Pyramimonas_sp.AAC.1